MEKGGRKVNQRFFKFLPASSTAAQNGQQHSEQLGVIIILVLANPIDQLEQLYKQRANKIEKVDSIQSRIRKRMDKFEQQVRSRIQNIMEPQILHLSDEHSPTVYLQNENVPQSSNKNLDKEITGQKPIEQEKQLTLKDMNQQLLLFLDKMLDNIPTQEELNKDSNVMFFQRNTQLLVLMINKIDTQIRSEFSEIEEKLTGVVDSNKQFLLQQLQETQVLFNHLLKDFTYNLLPEGQKLISNIDKDLLLQEDQLFLTQKLDSYLDYMTDHLENKLKPKLLDTREQFHNDINQIQRLIELTTVVNQQHREMLDNLTAMRSQLGDELPELYQAVVSYKKVVEPKIKEKLTQTLEMDILNHLLDQQQSYIYQLNNAEKGVTQIVREYENIHNQEAFNYVFKLRKLCYLIQNEIYQGLEIDTQGKQQLVNELSQCDDDPLVMGVVKKLGSQNIPSLNQLREEYFRLKEQAYFNLFVTRNSICMFLLGNFRIQLKNLIYGEFNKDYNHGYINFQNENRMLKQLKILDYSSQYLIEGQLNQSIELIQNLDHNEKVLFKNWLQKAQQRQKAEEALNILKFHSDYITEIGIQKLNEI